jgi:hypothetical protein
VSDKYRKEDPERAQAVMDHIHNVLWRYGAVTKREGREVMRDLEPWLMSVFRAVRGERD